MDIAAHVPNRKLTFKRKIKKKQPLLPLEAINYHRLTENNNHNSNSRSGNEIVIIKQTVTVAMK